MCELAGMSSVWEIETLDLDAYLDRIGLAGGLTPGADTLTAVHRAHLAAIPFENLDIVLGRGIDVALDAVQAKLVTRRRGGYCYEHGLLLAAALERLGFGVERLLARVGEDRERPRGRTHMLLRVRAAGETWLADTGFGSGLLEPLPWGAAGPRRQGGWTFRLVTDGPRTWWLHERRGEEWLTHYRFDDTRVYPADVVLANHYTSTWPVSPFVTRTVVSRKTPDALHQLTDDQLTVTRPDGSVEERDVPVAELGTTLRAAFGLELSAGEVDALARAR
jgi:N-hydroxyarylamine O-acetyltransferase